MKKFNLFKEIITVNKQELLTAMNTGKEFGINIKGEIKPAPYEEKEILIFSGKNTPKLSSAVMPSKSPTIEEFFGSKYQIVEDDDRVLIKAFSNWQELIGLNIHRASYDDTTGDGVDKFFYAEHEDIGWKATDFNIKYRDIVEYLEENCEGTLFCIEQEEPQYQFSGLGFFADDEEVKTLMFNYSKEIVAKMIEEDPLYTPENLDEDEEEAAEFFGCL